MASSQISFTGHFQEIIKRWPELQDVPKVFAYRLHISESKYLPGSHYFYAGLNAERNALRRKPQTIESLRPAFDEAKFNFKKIQPQECMATIPYGDDSAISMIINNSPLTKYHTLICPDVNKGLPQVITLQALKFCIDFLLEIHQADVEGSRNFRIGYNSPGALASVNHLHLHLMHFDMDLYVDKVKLCALAPGDIYRLDASEPTEAICFIIYEKDTLPVKEAKIERLYAFLKWLCDSNVPHNLFMTPDRCKDATEKNIKVFVYAREEYCYVKELDRINVGCSELSGYVTVGEKLVFDSLTESDVVAIINTQIGQIFRKIYAYFTNA